MQNTLGIELNACVDWLQVTFKSFRKPELIISLLGLDFENFIEIDNGKYGYDSQMRFGHIAIYYNKFRDVGSCHLEMTGQGCREYEQFGQFDFRELLQMCFKFDVNITRFDGALDDKVGYFTTRTIERKIQKGEVRTRFKKARVLTEYVLNDGSTVGQTCYFGSPQSDIVVRIYDKYKQMLSLERDVTGFNCWVRTEIQMRDDRAFLAAKAYAESEIGLPVILKGILSTYITFVNKGKDSNKARWKTSPFWKKFLDDVEKIKLTVVAPEASVERAKNWFENSVAPTFSLLCEAFDYNVDLLMEWFDKGREKRSKKHENMLSRFRYEQEQINREKDEKKKVITKELLSPRKITKKRLSSIIENSVKNG